MKIALYGIGGTYNYGCDAIVRGTEITIHSSNPDAQIDYYTYSYSDDVERLKDCNVRLVPIYKNQFFRTFLRIITKFEIITGISKNAVRLSNILKFGWVRDYDAVLSIGGDIYTLPPKSQCSLGSNYTNSLLEFGEICRLKKVPLIIWGASIGPFDEEPLIKDVFINHLKNCITHIVVRESRTKKYLFDNGIKNVSLHGDPAFAVEANIENSTRKNRIGINLSPLSLQYDIQGKSNIEHLEKQANTIKELAENFKMGITLIPHVFSSSPSDDDNSYLAKLEKLLKDDGVDAELKQCNGFLDAKKELAQCRLVISARMHCAINAITCGVPSIFLSYSEKSRGMSEMVYGTEDFAVPLAFFEDSEGMVLLVKKVFAEEDAIREKILERVHDLRKSACEAYRCLSDKEG